MKVIIILLVLGGLAFFYSDKIVLLLDAHFESKIVKNNLDGEVDKCTLDGKTYYSVGKNAHSGTETGNVYDNASGFIFDTRGGKVGVCNYADDLVDSICKKMEQCQPIYRVYPNIWGLPEVKYNP